MCWQVEEIPFVLGEHLGRACWVGSGLNAVSRGGRPEVWPGTSEVVGRGERKGLGPHGSGRGT